MVKSEIVDNGQRIRHFSDLYKIRQIETGIVYDEAVDILPCMYTYSETDERLSVIEDVDRQGEIDELKGGEVV